MAGNRERLLVVVADDLGRSASVNEAIAEAHENGIVTAASIMAGGAAFEDGVRTARRLQSLSVGLHLTLCDGRPVLPPSEIPGLVERSGRFPDSPSRAWIRLSRPSVLRQIDREIKAQFDLLERAGIRPSHVDGHHHLHMQPAVFSLLCRRASRYGAGWVRVPHEPLASALGSSRGAMPVLEWAVFGVLRSCHQKSARQHGLGVTDRVLGLARTGQIDERTLLDMIRGAEGVTEIFAHPDKASDAGRRELQALVAPAVRSSVASRGITLQGYRELRSGRTGGPVPERV